MAYHTGPVGTGSELAKLLIRPEIGPKRKRRPKKRRVPPRPSQFRGYR